MAATCHSPWNLVYVHPPEFLAGIFSLPAGNTSGLPCAIVSCSLLMHVHWCCWNGLAGFSQCYIKILHVLTQIQYIYIYILHTPALTEYNGLEGSFVKVQHAACQVFNGNVGHFRILQKCYKQCILLAIYRLLFSQANSNTTTIKTMHYNLKHVTSRRFIA